MVGSVFGVFFYGSNGSTGVDASYNGVKIEQTDYGYLVEVDNQEYLFQTHPTYLENLDLVYFDNIIATGGFALSFNPDHEAVAFFDAARLMLAQAAQTMNIIYAEGISKESAQYPLQVITCELATESMPVILFETGNVTSVNFENNCLIINAPAYISAQYIQALQYKVLGIM